MPIRSLLVFVVLFSSILLFDITASHLVPTKTVSRNNNKLSTVHDLSARSETDGKLIKPLIRQKRWFFTALATISAVAATVTVTCVAYDNVKKTFGFKREVHPFPAPHTIRFRNMMNRTMEIDCKTPDELYGTRNPSTQSEHEIASTDMPIKCT